MPKVRAELDKLFEEKCTVSCHDHCGVPKFACKECTPDPKAVILGVMHRLIAAFFKDD